MASSTEFQSGRPVQVLIIGAGVVGLSASLFLAHHDIKSIVVERRSGTSIHPRARSVNARTMELFRRLGIADLVREAGASIAASSGMFQGQSLREVIEARPRKDTTNGASPLAGFMETTSPEIGTFVTQDKLEPVLVEEARKRGVDIKFDTQCEHVEQSSGSVTAHLRTRKIGKSFAIQAPAKLS